MPLYLYILKRILIALPTVALVSLLGFTLMRYDFTVGPVHLPRLDGGPAVVLVPETRIKNPINPLAALEQNPQISKEALAREKERLGLNRPFWEQYGLWLGHLFQFHPDALAKGEWQRFFTPDLGRTFTGDSVSKLLTRHAGNTLLLNIASLAVVWLVALPLGLFAALRWRSTADRLLTVFSAVGMALPSFVLALLLAVFAVKTGWFPLGGLTSANFETLPPHLQLLDVLHHLALPVIVLTVIGVAGIQRQMRGNLLEVLGAEYVRMARAKGLPENTVIYKHAVRTAINPLVTMMGYEFAALLSGSVLIETVLGFPGLGSLTYQAVLQTDTNLVMASLVLSSVMLVLGNLFADILLKWVDPRIELSS
jgi:peptide/nickel transport system permease protein